MVGPPGMAPIPLPFAVEMVFAFWAWRQWGDDIRALLARARRRR